MKLLLMTIRVCILLLALIFNLTLADPTPVRVESRCPDKTNEYDISRHAIAEVNALFRAKIVND